MLKKFLLVLMVLLSFGCNDTQVKTVKKASGDSKAYLFFKDFDVSNYYISFFDRNASKNDDTRIVFARSDDRYYYEISGEVRQGILQKDGIRYTIDFNNNSYYKEEKELEDFSYGIIPFSISDLKTAGYKTGYEKVYNVKYVFEKYNLYNGESTYYFKGKKLIYIRYKNAIKNILLRFDEVKNKFSDDIFDINSNLTEITY